MLFCIWTEPAANGEPYRMSFRPGQQCGATSEPFAMMGYWERMHNEQGLQAPGEQQ